MSWTTACFASVVAVTACGGSDDGASPLRAAAGDEGASDPASPREIELAPPAFDAFGGTAVPVDIVSAEYRWTFDVATESASADDTIEFEMPRAGFPLFLLRQAVTNLVVDGTTLPVATLATYSGAPVVQSVRVLVTPLAAGRHVARVGHAMVNPRFLTFESGPTGAPQGVDFITEGKDVRFVDDVDGEYSQGFWEKYAPSNYEYDRFPVTVDLAVTGAAHPHRVMANGVVTDLGPAHWKVTFPDYYNSSSPLLHVLDPANFDIVTGSYSRPSGDVPVTVYSKKGTGLSEPALSTIVSKLSTFETKIGPFAHERFLAYVTTGEAMEYAGAAVTLPDAIAHEVAHSWFGRGVMPASGRDGWLDEALVTWLEDLHGGSYARDLDAEPTAAGVTSRYEELSSGSGYSSCANMMALLDFVLAAEGGLLPIARAFYADHVHRTLHWESFRDAVVAAARTELKPYVRSYFARWVEYESVAATLPPGVTASGVP